MDYLIGLMQDAAGTVGTYRDWMVFNTVLALIPAVLAAVLFVPGRRHGAVWWIGVVVFALFLPNAPYVITDLIHLRRDVAVADSDGVLIVGVLPSYAAFIGVAFLSYLYCVQAVVAEVQRWRPTVPAGPVEIAIHLVCSMGIVLGRLARLNSWDTLTSPRGTVESTFAALTWRGAPLVLVVVFLAVWITHAVTRSLLRTFVAWVTRTWAVVTRIGRRDRNLAAGD